MPISAANFTSAISPVSKNSFTLMILLVRIHILVKIVVKFDMLEE
jgi:hypothetical protein